jgi:hypothetical protein
LLGLTRGRPNAKFFQNGWDAIDAGK